MPDTKADNQEDHPAGVRCCKWHYSQLKRSGASRSTTLCQQRACGATSRILSVAPKEDGSASCRNAGVCR